jgi:hypothetical protein
MIEIINIIDKSGSMESRTNDAIGGFNAYLAEQKKDPEVRMTTVLFDTTEKTLYENLPVADVPPLDHYVYRCGGATALLDAVGSAIDRVGKRLANTPEDARPRKVIVAILTDGEENSSHVYKHEQVAEMIKHQQDVYKWEFAFLASGMDAWSVGAGLNIKGMNTHSVDLTNARGVALSYTAYNDTVNFLKKSSP